MFKPHEGTLQLKHKFQEAYNWLEKCGSAELLSRNETPFVAIAKMTQKGPHSGEKVIRFMLDGIESARAYGCCWGHYYNCNRTSIGMYCKVLDIAVV